MATTAVHLSNGDILYTGMSHQSLVKSISENDQPFILNASRKKDLKDNFNALIVIQNVMYFEELEG
ncbi:hypothetical protein [Macrococcus sp. DPC7161]|uniref:hypothetical protein n=1 Tax=Macrococcus sp. DPC7161 TaxID=2507060 RepID=UPI00100A4498|nr:hypothetical protein [Macrococcus sp. DPC7161]RXK17795.1 hypothetical protein ER639_08370 [Macrococcus sp. DPC7161]